MARGSEHVFQDNLSEKMRPVGRERKESKRGWGSSIEGEGRCSVKERMRRDK